MYIGHMQLNSRIENKGVFACSDCGENFTESSSRQEDCDDSFGGHSWFTECCPHCGSECIFRGKIFLNKVGKSFAKKDHYSCGKVIIATGQRYIWNIIKGYKITDNGKHEPYYSYHKELTS